MPDHACIFCRISDLIIIAENELAFAIRDTELARWEAWLAENGIAVEEKRTWELGGVSVYFRDPDRHLLEIATPGVWSIY